MPALFLLLLLQSGTALAVRVGQADDFEDGTRQAWEMGLLAATTSNMTNVADGGPGGMSDNYLEVVSDGTLVAGGRLTFFNQNQWSGDYTSAGITAIAMDLKNLSSSEPLQIRLAIEGGFLDPVNPGSFIGGLFATSANISLEAGTGWTHAVFSLLPAALTPVSGRSGVTGNDVLAALGNVTELRLLNSELPDWNGLPVSATLGIDNIQAVPLPPTALLFGSGLLGLGIWQRRRR
jgi:hypothetical protein